MDAIGDYEPLTLTEVGALLWEARHGTNGERNRIQIRLGRAVIGSTCPSPGGGLTARVQAWLDHAFVDWCETGNLTAADSITTLLTAGSDRE